MKHLDNIIAFFKRLFKKEEGGIVPTPTPTPDPTDLGIYLTTAEVKAKLKEQLASKFSRDAKIYLPDTIYYCPSVAYTKKVLAESSSDKRLWVEEVFDCDDHALVLKADFAIDAYRNGTRRAPHAFGIVWGQLPGPHAINFVLNDDGIVRFVEPQNDLVFLPRETDKGIWLMLS